MRRKDQKPRQKIPSPIELDAMPSTYQPGKEELEERHDMPGLTKEQVQKLFFRPFKMNKRSVEDGNEN